MADKFYLQVTAGPSYDRSTHKLVRVNSDSSLRISNAHADIDLSVKIQGFRGIPEDSPPTHPYFNHPSHLHDQYSISFAFPPHKSISGQDLVFGNDFDSPIRDRLPPGFNTAFKIVKWAIDPGLDGDVYSDTPHLYGPALSSLNVLRVGEKTEKLPEWHNEVITEGGERGEVPMESAKRMKYFLNEEHRKAWTFEAGRVYEADFFNPYLDFNDFALRLPGFTLPILKYLDAKNRSLRPHKLRYVLKNSATNDVYFVVVFTLFRKDGRDGGDDGGFTSDLSSSDEEVEAQKDDVKTNGVTHDNKKGDIVNDFVPQEDDVD